MKNFLVVGVTLGLSACSLMVYPALPRRPPAATAAHAPSAPAARLPCDGPTWPIAVDVVGAISTSFLSYGMIGTVAFLFGMAGENPSGAMIEVGAVGLLASSSFIASAVYGGKKSKTYCFEPEVIRAAPDASTADPTVPGPPSTVAQPPPRPDAR